jgi:uncharacterized membrane protein (UPF0136 family)
MPRWVLVGYLLIPSWGPALAGVLLGVVLTIIGLVIHGGFDAGITVTAFFVGFLTSGSLYFTRWRSGADWAELEDDLRTRGFGQPPTA